MHFQRTLNRFSRENVPGYLAVFIGGFGDMFAGCLSRVEKGFPGFCRVWRTATAYYHWDGGGCGVFFDRCGKIAVELEELRRRYPGLPVVLIGTQLRRLLRGGSSQAPVGSGCSSLPPDGRCRGAQAKERASGLCGMVGERLPAGWRRLHGRGAQNRRTLGTLRRG